MTNAGLGARPFPGRREEREEAAAARGAGDETAAGKSAAQRAGRGLVRGHNQKALFRWLRAQGGHVVSANAALARMTGIEARTVWRILALWEQRGVIARKADRSGTEIRLLISDAEAFGDKDEAGEDWKRERLWDRIQICFPRLYASGLRVQHCLRLISCLREAGFPTDTLPESLRFAEYELENGLMKDARGNPVASPLNWVYRILCKEGIYRVPKGYVTPAERRRRELAELTERERKATRELCALREEQARAEAEELTENLLREVLANPESEFSLRFTERVPALIRARGVNSKLYVNAVRVEISAYVRVQAGLLKERADQWPSPGNGEKAGAPGEKRGERG